MDSAIYDIIAKRREEQKKESREERRGVQERAPPRDLLDVLLRASTEKEEEEEDGSGSGSIGKDKTKTPATTLSAGELRDHMFTFLAAGTETTATTTAWLLLELCKNPHLQEKVLADIDRACAHKSSALEPFEYEDVEKLVYLQAALKEILRLHPPATVIGRNNVEPVRIGGQYTVPRMTNLIVSIYSLHHNPDFWDKPEEFIPERFLPENAQATMKHPWQYVPFSAGPRNCIGQRFARYEVLSIVATILRRFRVSMTPSALAEYIIEETVVRRPVSLRMTFHLREQSG
jgi:cytochrome P450 family 4